MSGFQRNAIVAEAAWDLTEAGKEKLAQLSEGVEFESEDVFRQKLNILKESFSEAAPQETAATSEVLTEGAEEPVAPSITEGMSAFDGRLRQRYFEILVILTNKGIPTNVYTSSAGEVGTYSGSSRSPRD